MARAFILVMDSVGIGGAPDAAGYGDAGADTLGHIAEWRARAGRPLNLPFMRALGLGEACRLASGRVPPGLGHDAPTGLYGALNETSRGKDTPSGHWELMGLPVTFDWGYFPHTVPAFPPELLAELCRRAQLPGTLANCHASGMAVIEQYAAEHISTGKPIVYTSVDSVLQIAASEEHFGLERLYEVCSIARELTRPLNIGRVIARPFVSDGPGRYRRTAGRRDYALAPPGDTLFDRAAKAGRDIITVGKVADIFAHRSTGTVLKGKDDMALFDALLGAADSLKDGGLLMANFVEFDTLYGHMRDVEGYASALERFDARLPEFASRLKADDLVLITADHGNDPTYKGTDHTRERVPLIGFGDGAPKGSFGLQPSYTAVADLVARHLGLP